MRVLILDRLERACTFDPLYQGIVQALPGSVHRKLTKQEVKELPKTLAKMDFSQFDRVLLDVPIRRAAHAISEICKIPGLVFFELDAYQELMPESKFYKTFLSYFKAFDGAPVIVTGYCIEAYLKENGVNAICIPKAFDNTLLENLESERDIDAAFIGRLGGDVYSFRKNALLKMQAELGMQILRTETAQEYLELLNRIKIFVSADIGLNEYMIKNFEAMACGCLLLAKTQETEDAKLGFYHKENIVLYETPEQAITLVKELLANPSELQRIALAGQQRVWQEHKLVDRIQSFVDVLTQPYPQRKI